MNRVFIVLFAVVGPMFLSASARRPSYIPQQVAQSQEVEPEVALPVISKSKEVSEIPSVPIWPPSGSRYHKVWIWQETQDCLWNLAYLYYGNPKLWQRIYRANRDRIKTPQHIFPKQLLLIPPLDGELHPPWEVGELPAGKQAVPKIRPSQETDQEIPIPVSEEKKWESIQEKSPSDDWEEVIQESLWPRRR